MLSVSTPSGGTKVGNYLGPVTGELPWPCYWGITLALRALKWGYTIALDMNEIYHDLPRLRAGGGSIFHVTPAVSWNISVQSWNKERGTCNLPYGSHTQ